MQETSEMYESEIRALKSNMGQANEINSRIAELEHELVSLEGVLKNSQVAEQDARAQLSKLADIENKVLEREQELNDTKQSLEQHREMIKQLQEINEDLQRHNNRHRRENSIMSNSEEEWRKEQQSS